MSFGHSYGVIFMFDGSNDAVQWLHVPFHGMKTSNACIGCLQLCGPKNVSILTQVLLDLVNIVPV